MIPGRNMPQVCAYLTYKDEQSAVPSWLRNERILWNVFDCEDSLVEFVERMSPSAIVVDGKRTNETREILIRLRYRVRHVPIFVHTPKIEAKSVSMFVRCGVAEIVDQSQITNLHTRIANAQTDEERHTAAFDGIVTRNKKMLHAIETARRSGLTHKPVLITGETGTGKDLIARAIHKASGRNGRYITENVAGLDDALVSDALFGHRRGAYTSAAGDKRGLVSIADRGTLFLDEIGDLSLRSQTKLLRLLEHGEFVPIGSDVPQQADVRMVFATNRDMVQLVAEHRFRRDLYYRVSVLQVHLPPLSERMEDVPLLAEHFINVASHELRKPHMELSTAAVNYLRDQTYPGNVRDLRSRIINAVAVCDGDVLLPKHFRSPTDMFRQTVIHSVGDQFIQNSERPDIPKTLVAFGSALPNLQIVSQQLVVEAMKRSHGSQSRAAALVGLTPSAFNKRLKRLSIA